MVALGDAAGDGQADAEAAGAAAGGVGPIEAVKQLAWVQLRGGVAPVGGGEHHPPAALGQGEGDGRAGQGVFDGVVQEDGHQLPQGVFVPGVDKAGTISGFADENAVSGYARTAMAWANGAGLISGMGDNTLAPRGTATRGQAAVILMGLDKLAGL